MTAARSPWSPRATECRKLSSNSVRDPAEPAATTGRSASRSTTQDDVDAVTQQPGSFVEAVLREPRGAVTDHERIQDGALRRRASARQFQRDRLAQRQPAEAA